MRLQTELSEQGCGSKTKYENRGGLQKKKGQRPHGYQIYSLLGFGMTQIVELTGDDLFFFFFFFGDHPNFRPRFLISNRQSRL